jgi:hypothetical protein
LKDLVITNKLVYLLLNQTIWFDMGFPQAQNTVLPVKQLLLRMGHFITL